MKRVLKLVETELEVIGILGEPQLKGKLEKVKIFGLKGIVESN